MKTPKPDDVPVSNASSENKRAAQALNPMGAISLKTPAVGLARNDSITMSAPVPRVDFDGANQPKLGEKGAEHVDYRL